MEKADCNLSRFAGLVFDRDRVVLEVVKRWGEGRRWIWSLIKYQLG